jgi:hypothetical protein
MYYTGNRAALSAVHNIRNIVNTSHPFTMDDREDVANQLDLIREEVLQLRGFINEHFPENDLPITTRGARN